MPTSTLATSTQGLNNANASIIDQKPVERVTLIANPETDKPTTLVAFLNPTSLEESIEVEWSHLPVVGLDHEVLHYSRTRSIELPMTFYFSAYALARETNNALFQANKPSQETQSSSFLNIQHESANQYTIQKSMDFANFFRSLCFPTRTGLRPPTVHVIWPSILNFNAVVQSVNFSYTKFDATLAPIIYEANVVFIETRITRRYSETVRDVGLVGDGQDPHQIQFTKP